MEEEESFEDWRDSGYLNPVKSQGDGVQRAILSPQDIWNNLMSKQQANDDKDGEKGCTIVKTLEWINENGCVLEKDCPYQEVLGPPAPSAERRARMRIETIKPLRFEELESHVKDHGPVIVKIVWTKELEELIGNAIYSGPATAEEFGKATKHGVLLIGFGTEMNEHGEPISYWIIQNSHDNHWGHKGFARMNRAPIHNQYLIKEGWAPMGIAYERPGINGAPYESL